MPYKDKNNKKQHNKIYYDKNAKELRFKRRERYHKNKKK